MGAGHLPLDEMEYFEHNTWKGSTGIIPWCSGQSDLASYVIQIPDIAASDSNDLSREHLWRDI